MGGPYYVVQATVRFKCDPEKEPRIRKIFVEKIAPHYRLEEDGFDVDDHEAEGGVRYVGWGYTPFVHDGDPDGTKRFIFRYDAPQTREGREHAVASSLNQIFPGIEAEAEFWREDW